MLALDWFIDRLTEPSTWRGLTALLTATGIVLSPDQSSAIIAAGLAVIGMINIFRKEGKKP